MSTVPNIGSTQNESPVKSAPLLAEDKDFSEKLDEIISCGNAQSGFAYGRIAKMIVARERAAIERFCRMVEDQAEANMLKTGKLEGAHYAALRKIRDEMRAANNETERSENSRSKPTVTP